MNKPEDDALTRLLAKSVLNLFKSPTFATSERARASKLTTRNLKCN